MKSQDEAALRGVWMWLDVAALSELTDRQLLDRFATGGGQPAEAAFAALVARHGPMVLRTCRAALGSEHDAEDAFQASFLVLSRRSRGLWVKDSLGPWLHRVASRLAARSRAGVVRRRGHERAAAELRSEVREPADSNDLGLLLRSEIERLPDCFRGPLVLCELEGRSVEEAATQLGCAIGTIKSRLSRARERLRIRLERRGVVPAAGGVAALFAAQSASAVPSRLAQATVGAAHTAGTVPASVLALADHEVKAMALHTLAVRFSVVLVGALATTGVLAVAGGRSTTEPEPAANESYVVAAPVPPQKPIPKELEQFQGYWKMELCDSAKENFGGTQQEASKWRWTVKGDEIVWGRKGEEWKLKLAVDPTQKPMQIDLTYLSGPHKGEKCEGMFEWGGIDGKTLMISIQDPGANVPRPKAIEMRGDGKTALIFLRKSEPIDAEKELSAFQGVWSFDNVMTDVWPRPIGKAPDKDGKGGERRWAIKDKVISWTGVDGKEVKASFSIDPHKVPRQIELTFLNGPDQGEKCPGIYEWLGDKELRICVVDPGREVDRPTEMVYSTNGGRTWIFLARK